MYKTRSSNYSYVKFIEAIETAKSALSIKRIKFNNYLYDYQHCKNTNERKRLYKKLYKMVRNDPDFIKVQFTLYPIFSYYPGDFDGDIIPSEKLSELNVNPKTFKSIIKHMIARHKIRM